MTFRTVHGRQLTDAFEVGTGVRKGCLLSPFLYLMAIDYVTKTSADQKRNGIQWTLCKQLGYLDFADDLARLSILGEAPRTLHPSKFLARRLEHYTHHSPRRGTANTTPITVLSEALEEVDTTPITVLGEELGTLHPSQS
ncbi:uncharacterized protein LOC127849161 [Dreissena polymorpha]|uniref:uncharacterized protein LOC127849161 n=1 Tax=Dreissena polymorpha TaxID=45954 RepID=UPI00226566CA|nr:uncharacterized protein LOC127849161 [Dreissena polymorpha]